MRPAVRAGPLSTTAAKLPLKKKITSEEAGRKVRYQAFAEVAAEVAAEGIERKHQDCRGAERVTIKRRLFCSASYAGLERTGFPASATDALMNTEMKSYDRCWMSAKRRSWPIAQSMICAPASTIPI